MTPRKPQWQCPRCGSEGTDLESLDPMRCQRCCIGDAGYAMMRTLQRLVARHNDDASDLEPGFACGCRDCTEALSVLRIASGYLEPNRKIRLKGAP